MDICRGNNVIGGCVSARDKLTCVQHHMVLPLGVVSEVFAAQRALVRSFQFPVRLAAEMPISDILRSAFLVMSVLTPNCNTQPRN